MCECQSVCVCTRAGNTNLRVCVREGGREERESAFSIGEGEKVRMMVENKENPGSFHAC